MPPTAGAEERSQAHGNHLLCIKEPKAHFAIKFSISSAITNEAKGGGAPAGDPTVLRQLGGEEDFTNIPRAPNGQQTELH